MCSSRGGYLCNIKFGYLCHIWVLGICVILRAKYLCNTLVDIYAIFEFWVFFSIPRVKYLYNSWAKYLFNIWVLDICLIHRVSIYVILGVDFVQYPYFEYLWNTQCEYLCNPLSGYCAISRFWVFVQYPRWIFM